MESRSDDRGRFVRQVRRRHAGSARGHTYGPIWRGSNGPRRLSDRRWRPDSVLADHRSGHLLPRVSASGDWLQHWRVHPVYGGGKRVDADSPGHSRSDSGGGSSAAGFAVPLLAWGISSYGWRPSMFFIGVVAMFIGPALFRVVSRRPPPTDRPRTAFSKSDLLRAGPARDFTGAEALRTRAFWAMALAHGLVNLSLAAVAAHIFQHLTGPEVGLGDLSAASIITLTAGFALVFQIGGGLVGDRLDKRIPISVLMICQAGGMALLAFVGSYASAIVFAFVWSLGFGGRTPMLHAMRGEYFGARHYGVILGFYSIPMSIGMMTAPVAVGFIFDIQDTYRWAFLGLSGACILGAILVLLATRPEPPAKLGATV